MASLLETEIRNLVTAGFKGQLLTGTLRREGVALLDSFGDVVPTAAVTHAFEGIRESFNAAFANQAGIPVTDVRILIIAGSLSVEPLKGDEIFIRSAWHEVREILERDPANATHILQCFEIEDPT